MNSLFTPESVSMMIMTVIATLVSHALLKVFSKMKWPSGATIGWAAMATRRFLPMLLNVLRYLFIFWFFGLQLHGLVTFPGPPSRWDTLLIAFWVFWANGLFVVMMFDLRLWKVDRLLDKG